MQKSKFRIFVDIVPDIVDIVVIGIDKRSNILIELFHIAAIGIHGIQVVIVIWIAEINRAVMLAENTIVVKIARCIAVDKGIIPMGSGGKIIKNEIAGNDKNNDCRNQKTLYIFHKEIPSVPFFVIIIIAFTDRSCKCKVPCG